MMGTTLISCRAGVYDGRREVLTNVPGHRQKIS